MWLWPQRLIRRGFYVLQVDFLWTVFVKAFIDESNWITHARFKCALFLYTRVFSHSVGILAVTFKHSANIHSPTQQLRKVHSRRTE